MSPAPPSTARRPAPRRPAPPAARRPPAPDPRLRARNAAVRRAEGRRRLRVLAWTAGAAAAAAGVLVLLHSPVLAARSVTVTGNGHESRAVVLAVSGLAARPPLIDVNTGADTAALERLPWVLRAGVARRWPDGASVRITERVALAEIALGPGRAAVVDPTGRVLAEGAPRPGLVELAGSGPVPAPGSWLRAADAPLLRVAAALPASIAPRVASVEAAGAQQVTLRLAGHGPLVELGSTADLRQKLVSLATLLARVPLSGVATVDLRVPASPVLTP